MKKILFLTICEVIFILCFNSITYSKKLLTEPVWLEPRKNLQKTNEDELFLFRKIDETIIDNNIYKTTAAMFSFESFRNMNRPWKIWGYDRIERDFSFIGYIPKRMKEYQSELMQTPASLHKELNKYIPYDKLFVFYMFEYSGEEISEKVINKMKIFSVPPNFSMQRLRVFKREQLSSMRFVTYQSSQKYLLADHIWPCVYFDETGYAFMVYDQSKKKPICEEIPDNPLIPISPETEYDNNVDKSQGFLESSFRGSGNSEITKPEPTPQHKYTTIGEEQHTIAKSAEAPKKVYPVVSLEQSKHHDATPIISKTAEVPDSIEIKEERFYYHENYGYIRINAITPIPVERKEEFRGNFFIMNIVKPFSEMNFIITPIKFETSGQEIAFYRPENTSLAFLWREEGHRMELVAQISADSNKQGQEKYKIHDPALIRWIDYQTGRALDNLKKSFEEINNLIKNQPTIFYQIFCGKTETICKDTFNEMIEHFNNRLRQDDYLKLNRIFKKYYVKDEKGGVLLLGAGCDYCIEKNESDWYFVHKTGELKKIVTLQEKQIKKQKIIKNRWGEMITCDRLPIFGNKNEFIYLTYPKNHISAKALKSNPEQINIKIARAENIGSWIIIDEYSQSGITENYQKFKISAKLNQIIQNCGGREKIRIDMIRGNATARVGKEYQTGQSPNPYIGKIDALIGLEEHKVEDKNLFWEMHLFLPRRTSGIKMSEVKELEKKLLRMNVIRLVLWEITNTKPNGKTQLGQVFEQVFEDSKIKYRYENICDIKDFENIKLPYTPVTHGKV